MFPWEKSLRARLPGYKRRHPIRYRRSAEKPNIDVFLPRLNLGYNHGRVAGGIATTRSIEAPGKQFSKNILVTSRQAKERTRILAAFQTHYGKRSEGRQRDSIHSIEDSNYLSAATVLRQYDRYLSSFEKSEILEYPVVYFFGKGCRQKVHGSQMVSNNSGYDDDRGEYKVMIHDHIAYRYEILSVLGRGSFGQVVKVHDHKTGNECALKVIRNKSKYQNQAMVEVRLLEFCKKNSNRTGIGSIVDFYETLRFRNHLCLTFELLGLNLYEFVKLNNFRGIQLSAIRQYAQQILESLQFLHANSIIHCDLKPENILLRRDPSQGVKVIDFGSSCFQHEQVFTYIQSRYYRSPEVMLGSRYSCSIDMFSFGLILAELFTGQPLFPGEHEIEQMSCIMEVMGLPPAAMIQTTMRRNVFFDSRGLPRVFKNSKGISRQVNAKSLRQALRCDDEQFVSFIQRCLDWNPAKRLTAQEALAHDWITGARTKTSVSRTTDPNRGELPQLRFRG